jgi:hypothetical protein
VNLFSDYNSIVKFKTHEDEIETRKGGALLLAIALSGGVAAQTTHQRSVHCKQCQRVLKVLNSGTGKHRTIAPY